MGAGPAIRRALLPIPNRWCGSSPPGARDSRPPGRASGLAVRADGRRELRPRTAQRRPGGNRPRRPRTPQGNANARPAGDAPPLSPHDTAAAEGRVPVTHENPLAFVIWHLALMDEGFPLTGRPALRHSDDPGRGPATGRFLLVHNRR